MAHRYFSSFNFSSEKTLKQRIEIAIELYCCDGDVLHQSRADGGWEVHFIHGKAFVFWSSETSTNNPEFIGYFDKQYYGDIADKLESLT